MGGIIAPIVSNMVMNELETFCFNSTSNDIILYACYVDNILITLKNGNNKISFRKEK